MTPLPSRPSTVDQALAQVARKLTEYDQRKVCGSAALGERMPLRRTGSPRCADAGNETAYCDRYAERCLARQRGNGSVCDEDLPQFARGTLGNAFKKTGVPSGNKTSARRKGRWKGARLR